MKVVINTCFGGFSLSDKAEDLYAEKSGFSLFRYMDGKEGYIRWDGRCHMNYTFKNDHGDSFNDFPEDGGYWYSREVQRDDPVLIEVVEELKEEASGSCADLCVVEIPDGVSWEIEEYDGNEHVAESHRVWG